MGQIKNIKLHIVTDIKCKLNTCKMSAYRGARVLSSLGQHAIRCNRLHQRRIVSLGLTSLCQVTTKHRSLLDTTTQPVNKYDLSTGTLASAVQQLFSTDAVVVSEDESELLNEEEQSDNGSLIHFTLS